MSNLTNPYDQGYEAFLQGTSQSMNPYPRDSDDHLDWNDGYANAEGKVDD